MTAGYSGTPLPRKLGIGVGTRVAGIGAPADFASTLGPLPEGAMWRPASRSEAAVVLVFAPSRAELARRFDRGANLTALGGRLWILWPKKTSALYRDLSENDVRAWGLARGWVDYKVCAVDAVWSGLCFARRK